METFVRILMDSVQKTMANKCGVNQEAETSGQPENNSVTSTVVNAMLPMLSTYMGGDEKGDGLAPSVQQFRDIQADASEVESSFAQSRGNGRDHPPKRSSSVQDEARREPEPTPSGNERGHRAASDFDAYTEYVKAQKGGSFNLSIEGEVTYLSFPFKLNISLGHN